MRAGSLALRTSRIAGEGSDIRRLSIEQRAGLEAFPHYMPDTVLSDWSMPIFDGLELAQMIRQPGANSNPYVSIIMLTGHSEKCRVMSARDAGIIEFMAKPISAQSLYQRILN